MDVIKYLDTPQPWAFSWCWLEVAGLAIFIIYFVIMTIFMMQGKMTGQKISLLLGNILVLIVIMGAGMRDFWVCRNSLRPTRY
jgi:hypothetical protein